MPKEIVLTSDQIKVLQTFLVNKDGSAHELARAQAIFMYANKMDRGLIEALTNVKKSAYFKWRSRFIKGGLEGLRDKKKRKPKSLLTKGQIQATLTMIKTQSPRAFGYETDFWTTSILAVVLKEQYGVEYKTKRPLYLLFKRARFSFHLPGKQYHKRSQAAIDQWVTENTPIIQKHLEDLNTVVLVGDEMILSTQTTSQKIWLPRNQFPKIDVSNKRDNRSLYGFLNIQNGVAHAFKTKRQDTETTCLILEQICQAYKGKKIVLLWDNAPWHRGQKVRDWLSATKHNIHLINFPTYAPELNPQEHVWKAGRANVSHNLFIDDIDQTANDFINYLDNNLFRYAFLGLVHA